MSLNVYLHKQLVQGPPLPKPVDLRLQTWFCWIAKLLRKTTKSEASGLCSKTWDLYDHTLHLGCLTEYFPTFCAKRALKVSAGVSLWRHLRWQMIIRYFYSSEIIFFHFPVCRQSCGQQPCLTQPLVFLLLKPHSSPVYWHILGKSFTASEKILFCCPCFQLSAAKLLLNLCPSTPCKEHIELIPGLQVQRDGAGAPWNGLGTAVGPAPSASPAPGEKTKSR